jgi:hypothetical protein
VNVIFNVNFLFLNQISRIPRILPAAAARPRRASHLGSLRVFLGIAFGEKSYKINLKIYQNLLDVSFLFS